MSESLRVYFITSGPAPHETDYGDVVHSVKAQASTDGGETVITMWFNFDTHENALAFKNEVNNRMEPTIIGEEEDE